MSASTKTTQDWTNRCQTVRALVPDAISKDAWVWDHSKYHRHLSLSYQHHHQAATLANFPDTELLASFYTHHTNEYPEFQSEEQKVSHLSLFPRYSSQTDYPRWCAAGTLRIGSISQGRGGRRG
ncbi:uncharacterized protein ASPGLDRAFT_48157 [Aspergillus glaucus CBS 516.65]|uniref:Uncharacterized protein n=1 Tax=Aspergillus glaucus CBS 516.65 TaxID=1160497 RepID=A0A1L9VI41_ASPGL|nr:hypothetical protein ASPGLDRAFT_48157 [Aspergillus glaucus CBS 516.65]OJJ83598.1 hypothetical protein ASPGLDRAFT_48157 [Aspergillus glaucus CBS 516.65]